MIGVKWFCDGCQWDPSSYTVTLDISGLFSDTVGLFNVFLSMITAVCGEAYYYHEEDHWSHGTTKFRPRTGLLVSNDRNMLTKIIVLR